MEYESKLYIVQKSCVYDVIDGKKMIFAEVVATFNLCKVYDVASKLLEYNNTNCFIYADDGNTRILEDKYGKALKEIPIYDAIKIIEEAAKTDDYRRFAPCLALLKGFKQDEWSNLVVLHYGY